MNFRTEKLQVWEEMANSITHGIGILLSIFGLVLLVVISALHGSAIQVVSFSIYGTSLILLYVASTLYHSFQSERIKRVFRLFDHSAIYVLIAGTYTPFTLISLRGGWGWSIFGVIWGLAILGISFKLIFRHRHEKVSTFFYLMMGWVIIIAIYPLGKALPAGGLAWLVAGGMAYTIGVIFYSWEKLPFHHAIWHLFVLSGSIFHFIAVLYYLTPLAQLA